MFVHVYMFIKKNQPTELLNTNETGKKFFIPQAVAYSTILSQKCLSSHLWFYCCFSTKTKWKEIEEERVSYFQR